MVKRILFVILVFVSTFAVWGKNTRNVEMKPFSKISVFGNFNVELIPGMEESLKLESEDVDLSKISISQDGNFLRINAAKNLFSSSKKVKVYVGYKQLSFIRANGGAHIESLKLVEKQDMKLLARNGANLNLPISAENLTVIVGQGASISLEGACGNLQVKANNGGLFNAYDLKATYVNAKARTGAIIKINALKKLDASVFINGQISYRGSPSLKVNQVFGGSVEKLTE